MKGFTKSTLYITHKYFNECKTVCLLRLLTLNNTLRNIVDGFIPHFRIGFYIYMSVFGLLIVSADESSTTAAKV